MKVILMKHLLFTLAMIVFASISVSAQTLKQTPSQRPELPKPLADAVAGGSQVMYLGEFEGLYGWSLIRQGRPEYFYVTKDGSAMVMGLLFDGAGEMITNGQLAQLRAEKGDEMFAMTGKIGEKNTTPKSTAPKPQVTKEEPFDSNALATSIVSSYEPLTPAQEMFVDIRSANWLTFGPNGKHEIFAFIDPDCQHCQRFIAEAKPLIDNGSLKVRALPIGLDPVSERKAALMLAGSNPMDRFLRYANGDESALSAPEGISVTAVQKNKSILLKWGFDVTPIIVYRAGTGEIRIIRGRPKDFDTVFRDIATQ
ncbi:MAG: hypothetical protein COB76_06030 [Alphaproteobacteria bacterium]|nr:MAG: hypothetical protein COB76_06030 [Alphaproteobacteria bacterium]